MNTNQKIKDKAKTMVLIDRHLQAESELLRQVESVTHELAVLLNSNPMHSLTTEQCERLVALTEESRSATEEIKKKRATIHSIINRNQVEPVTLREFIKDSDPITRTRLESRRTDLLDRQAKINAIQLGNQAIAGYEMDHHKQLLSGWLQCNIDEKGYDSKGQSIGIKPGNLYGRVC